MATIAIFPNSNFNVNKLDKIPLPTGDHWIMNYSDNDYLTMTPNAYYDSLHGLFPTLTKQELMVGFYIKKIKLRTGIGTIDIIKVENCVDGPSTFGPWDPSTEPISIIESVNISTEGVNIIELSQPFYVDSASTRLGVMTPGENTSENKAIYYGSIVNEIEVMNIYRTIGGPSYSKAAENKWQVCVDYFIGN